jgi:hypothetical protein
MAENAALATASRPTHTVTPGLFRGDEVKVASAFL